MKSVLVTGANRGIGKGFVDHYLKEGWRVIGTARDVGVFDEERDRFIPLALDVSDDASIKNLAVELKTQGIQLDLLINNAGISIEEPFGEWSTSHFLKHVQVNAVGPALLAQELLPLLNKGAKVVNLSTGMASLKLNVNAQTGLDAYAVSKAAMNMMSRHLAEKVREQNIAVLCLSPGWVQTAMGGAGATSTVEEAVAGMTSVIEQLTMEKSGSFMDEKGAVLPW